MPVLAELAAGAVTGLAVAMPFGAVGAHLVGLAARSRWTTATAAALGVATVDGAYAVVASLGGVALRTVLGRVSGVLQVVAASVLVAVALWTAWTAVRRHRHPAAERPAGGLTPRRAYLTLVAMTAVNPATLVTFSAVVLGRGSTGTASWAATTAFAGGALAASAAWQLLLVAGGSVLGRLLSGARAQLGLGLLSAAVVLALAVGLLA